MRRRAFTVLIMPLAMLAGCATATDTAMTSSGSPASAATAAPAPLSQLVSQVDIPYERFTLDNGLRVLVHTDRKAPVVAVSVWYNVGSKHEPEGKTGFAHLFEHLMFNGTENVPGDFFEPLRQIGATNLNGTTWFDRTNYFENVPTQALERALFLESDRMGHLLGAVTQQVLDNQRGVVQNEKRQGDNEPYGLVEYAQLAALFPEGHPYGHSTIGSMADLDAASLEDVRNWFRQHYGPNNAVLVLAGDIDAQTARPLVERYFGDIPRGPQQEPIAAPVPTLSAPKTEVMRDRVATTRIYRNWVVPGLTDPETVALSAGAGVLGGLSSSRLDNILVRQERLAVSVSANVQDFAQIGMFEVTVNVRPGVDPATVSRRLDEIMADYIRTGPTADEVSRYATRAVAGRIAGLEQVGGFGGKAVALAEGELYANNPELYKQQLQATAALTPAEIQAALQKWLTRPVYALSVVPGAREAYQEAGPRAGGFAGGTSAPRYYHTPEAGEAPLAPLPAQAQQRPATPAPAPATRPRQPGQFPPVGQIADLDFPDVTRARLSNGIEVVYANRDAVPITQVAISFDAGNAADPKDALGTQALMLSLLDEGTTTRNSIQIAEEQERLGAQIGANASMDRTTATLFALSANLTPSMALFGDVVKNPAFAPAEVERLRAQQLAEIAAELTQPQAIALRTLPPLLYGAQHPYGVPFTGTGDPAAVARVTREQLAAFHSAWMRPDKAKIFVVSDRPLAEVQPLLEAQFGRWQPTGTAGTKDIEAAVPAPRSRIVLVNRPDSPQSVIFAGELLPVEGTDDLETLVAANDILGGNFLSRINMDLREQKGWSYGVRGIVNRVEGQVPYIVLAPVQQDRTGDSIRALRDQMTSYLGSNGTTQAELERTVNGSIRELPGSYETAGAVLAGMMRNDLYKRPDDFYDTLAARYRAMTVAAVDQAARANIKPDQILWVVVGDAARVRPQLEGLGLPVEVVELAPASAAPAAPAAQPAAR
ncbi:putative Zn-dependent peptidase [Sphingomonas jejuensis]|uniref:Zn-dependent peptidase n=1 Tax=Sphingomonas jejuensis TaxID=904715 RepID=A0ABX0XMW1_9SPHN|nr:pitrilysin family protein [Sphingomonas jejuensis]NJC34538.1 putative Zn-dependent peptidase [Sphingomonas jejuensis]